MTAALRIAGVRFGARPIDVAFVALWAVCLVAHAYGGPLSDAAFALVEETIIVGLYLLTRRFTDPPAETRTPPPRAVPGGIIVAALIVLPALAVAGVSFAGREVDMTVWFAFVGRAGALLQRALPFIDIDSLDNFVGYAIVPAVVLLVLGWRAPDLGLGPSRRGTLRALALWASLPVLVYVAMALAMGHGKPAALAHRWLIDLFRNGFAEEILWRGIVLRLLIAPLGFAGANVVQALAFGLLHLRGDLNETHGVLWNALADGVATQAFNGYVMGLLRLRTGNVLVPGVFHALIDGGAVFA